MIKFIAAIFLAIGLAFPVMAQDAPVCDVPTEIVEIQEAFAQLEFGAVIFKGDEVKSIGQSLLDAGVMRTMPPEWVGVVVLPSIAQIDKEIARGMGFGSVGVFDLRDCSWFNIGGRPLENIRAALMLHNTGI